MDLGIEAPRPACVDASRSLAARNVRQAICESTFNAKAQRLPCSLLVDHPHRRRGLVRLFGDMHEVLRSVPHNPTKSQWPASRSNTRIAPSSSCVEGKPFRHAERRAKRDPPSEPRTSLDRVPPTH